MGLLHTKIHARKHANTQTRKHTNTHTHAANTHTLDMNPSYSKHLVNCNMAKLLIDVLRDCGT